MLDQYALLAKTFLTPSDSPPDSSSSFLADFPHLAGFLEKFAALPENAAYLASPLHTKLPFNNKSAVFASAPGGGRFAAGTPCDWHGLTGDY